MNWREFLVSTAVLGASIFLAIIYGLRTGSAQNDDRELQARSNGVMWHQDRWKHWV